MEANKNQETKSTNKSIDYSSLISSAVGAVSGVVAANSIQSAMAAEVTVDPNQDPTPAPAPTPQPAPAPTPTLEPVVVVDDNVTIVYTETVDMGGGQMADLAIGINSNGNEVAFVDVNRDGIIDFQMEDANHDGQIGENEVVDVQSQHISMSELTREAEDLALLDDYNSNANVDDFLA